MTSLGGYTRCTRYGVPRRHTTQDNSITLSFSPEVAPLACRHRPSRLGSGGTRPANASPPRPRVTHGLNLPVGSARASLAEPVRLRLVRQKGLCRLGWRGCGRLRFPAPVAARGSSPGVRAGSALGWVSSRACENRADVSSDLVLSLYPKGSDPTESCIGVAEPREAGASRPKPDARSEPSHGSLRGRSSSGHVGLHASAAPAAGTPRKTHKVRWLPGYANARTPGSHLTLQKQP